MFYRDQDFYRAQPLDRFGWLVHGFGTRFACPPEGIATLHQIHSALCLAADGRTGCLGDADALLENLPGHSVAVKTADCIPVLLADERNRAVAAVHAGWRGTAAGIVEAAMAAMGDRFGTRPADLHAAIGPGIGVCCYEVGPDTAMRLGLSAEAAVHVDLPRINWNQLLEAGIPAAQIYVADLCTRCRPEEFYSFRRDREQAGRMYSFIGIR